MVFVQRCVAPSRKCKRTLGPLTMIGNTCLLGISLQYLRDSTTFETVSLKLILCKKNVLRLTMSCQTWKDYKCCAVPQIVTMKRSDQLFEIDDTL